MEICVYTLVSKRSPGAQGGRGAWGEGREERKLERAGVQG